MSPDRPRAARLGRPATCSASAPCSPSPRPVRPVRHRSSRALIYRVVHGQPDLASCPASSARWSSAAWPRTQRSGPPRLPCWPNWVRGQLDAQWLPEQLTQAFGRYAPPDLTGSGTPWPGARSTPSPTLRATPPPTLRGTPSPAPALRRRWLLTVRRRPPSAARHRRPLLTRHCPSRATPARWRSGRQPAAGGDRGRSLRRPVRRRGHRSRRDRSGRPWSWGAPRRAPGARAAPGRTDIAAAGQALVWILLTAALVGGIAAIIVPKVINATPASQSQPTTGTQSTPGSSRPLQTEGSGSRSAGPSSVPQASPSTVAGSTSPVTGNFTSCPDEHAHDVRHPDLTRNDTGSPRSPRPCRPPRPPPRPQPRHPNPAHPNPTHTNPHPAPDHPPALARDRHRTDDDGVVGLERLSWRKWLAG